AGPQALGFGGEAIERLDLQRTAAGAQAPVTMRRANGTLVVGPGVAPPRLYAVPFWSAASPGVLQGYKLFDSASDAVALFRALTASAPTQASIDAAAEAALRLEAGAGSEAGADRLVLNADRRDPSDSEVSGLCFNFFLILDVLLEN
ncbi:MAG: hypothetical protein ACK5PR_02865, partial [bacterium]